MLLIQSPSNFCLTQGEIVEDKFLMSNLGRKITLKCGGSLKYPLCQIQPQQEWESYNDAWGEVGV